MRHLDLYIYLQMHSHHGVLRQNAQERQELVGEQAPLRSVHLAQLQDELVQLLPMKLDLLGLE